MSDLQAQNDHVSADLHIATLARIAADHEADRDTVFVENNTVFYRRAGDLYAACAMESKYWHEVQSGLITERVIALAKMPHTGQYKNHKQ